MPSWLLPYVTPNDDVGETDGIGGNVQDSDAGSVWRCW
jgi:hypothetical protein